ncbi:MULTISPECIES: toll/interleukin-1 receptor domain-containing protein [Aeromonas]|uniref:toll/interleukin-1 receptor domain-containing protein n=1 Tax=Aeromonas TaxID=642 RepID=UPI001322A48B|nr:MULTISPECIES: toll/interleukin-1 receptor domain-containing protein [Aeromonas]MCX0438195.1 toll/interleukin-1 receptor domain-containing protein [Aeromonas veronii]MXQ69980.1 TIR domain-containing protein [Aeromonas caviae]QJT27439.1 toll/interleukin-1 receptor domain-containing protein [Aeromonas media]
MDKPQVKFFVSYAHANRVSKEQFMALFSEQTAISKRFDYQYWSDSELTLGDHWRDEIARAQAETDFGLLLISPAFLASKFIVEQELPTYLAHGGKRCFPLMLRPVDFERHDLKGLQDQQIYRLHSADFSTPRAFTDLKGQRRAEFAHGVFAQIDDWLAANLK